MVNGVNAADSSFESSHRWDYSRVSHQSTQINCIKSDGRTIAGELLHPNLNKFFKFVNGVDDNDNLVNKFNLKDLAKSIWPLHVPLQLIGLVSKRVNQIARGFYGCMWALVYSFYRPWAVNRDKLVINEAEKKDLPASGNILKALYTANENFRVFGGSLVSLVYGGGALGMLYGALSGNDDIYEKSSECYQEGMLSQNPVFDSMSLTTLFRSLCNKKQLTNADKDRTDKKALTERWQAAMFIPDLITRSLSALRFLGMEFGEGIQRVIDAVGYFGYGLWGANIGLRHEKIEDNSTGTGNNINNKKINKNLDDFYRTGAKTFYTVIPSVSWVAAAGAILGYGEFAKKTFELEGKIERLLPMISGWSIRDTWLKWFGDV